MRSTRNFIRKWGHFVKHDELMKPIIPPKYDIGIDLQNDRLGSNLLEILEPWCSVIYVNCNREEYIKQEQPNTIIDLGDKIRYSASIKENDIMVNVDGTRFTQEDFNIIQQLSEIINDSGEIGEFELGNIKLDIRKLNTYENDLIVCGS